MVMEHSSHLIRMSLLAYMTRHAIHIFSLRAFVCTVCVNSQRNSRANKKTRIANLETQIFLDVSFKSQTIHSEIYHQMITRREIMVGDLSKYIFDFRVGSQ